MPKKEYIDKELLLKSAKKYGIPLPSIMMNTVPAADVKENVRGEWTDLSEDDFGIVKCSNCEYKTLSEYDFCPNCGADMREKERTD